MEKIGLQAVFETEVFKRNLEDYNKKIDAATKSTESGGAKMGAALAKGAAIGVAAIAAIAVALTATLVVAFKKSYEEVMEWGEGLHVTMERLGGFADQAAGLALIADVAGMQVDDITTAIDLMAKGLESAKGVVGTSGTAIKNLGIDVYDANGHLRDSYEIFSEVATKVNAMPPGLEKTAIMMQIFGRSGAKMAEVLELAAGGGMQKFIDKAGEMGLSLSDKQIDQVKKLDQSIALLHDQFKGIGVTLMIGFIPALQKVVTWLGNMVMAAMPAIQNLGGFLTTLLGIQNVQLPDVLQGGEGGAPVSTAPTAPADWQHVGTDVPGFYPGELYWSPSTGQYNIGQPSAPMGQPAQAPAANISTTGFQTPNMSGMAPSGFEGVADKLMEWEANFETAINGFIATVKTEWPGIVANFKTLGESISQIDWLTFSQNMLAVVAALAAFMASPAVQWIFSHLSLAAAIITPLASVPSIPSSSADAAGDIDKGERDIITSLDNLGAGVGTSTTTVTENLNTMGSMILGSADTVSISAGVTGDIVTLGMSTLAERIMAAATAFLDSLHVPKVNGIPQKWAGGYVGPGQSALVGDWPGRQTGYEELLTVLAGGGAMVTPMHQAPIGNFGGGGITLNLNAVINNGMDATALAYKVADVIKRR
jgi:hypothetical protein